MPRLRTPSDESLTADAVLRDTSRAIIVGVAGIGKTTLLRFLAHKYSKAHLAEPKNNPAAAFIPARYLSRDCTIGEVQRVIARVLGGEVKGRVTSGRVERYLEENRLILLIDGLDEIEPGVRPRILYEIDDLSRRYSDSGFVLSTRPIDLTVHFQDFALVHLEEFGTDQVEEFALRLHGRERGEAFIEAIAHKRSLGALARNPLLLGLLSRVYEARGQIPSTSMSLYSDFTDYLMSTWEAQKSIGSRSLVSLRIKHLILEELAFYHFRRQQQKLCHSDLTRLIQQTLAHEGLSDIEVPAIVQELLASGLLVQADHERVSFCHMHLLEYYVARAVSRDPNRAMDLISQPAAHQVVISACELIDDIGSVIEAAIAHKQVLLAAQCLSHSRTSDERLIDLVIKEFVQEVGEPFIGMLVSTYAPEPLVERDEKYPEDDYAKLLNLWYRFSTPNLPPIRKGKSFEEFASVLFGHVFKVVSRNLNTENGEIDLVLEIVCPEPFWIEFGGDALVECKNWTSRIPLKEVGSFCHKVAQARVKLGFIVSVSGFTDDAIRALQNLASNVNAPLVVPISGDGLKKLIRRRGQFDEFFKDKIREIKYVRKY